MLQCFGFSPSSASQVMEFAIHLINMDDFDELKEHVSDEDWEILRLNYNRLPKFLLLNCLSSTRVKELRSIITKKLDHIINVEGVLYNNQILEEDEILPLVGSNFLTFNEKHEELFYNYEKNQPKFTFSSSSYRDFSSSKENSSSLYFFSLNSSSIPHEMEVKNDGEEKSRQINEINKKLSKNYREDDNFFRPRLLVCYSLNLNFFRHYNHYQIGSLNNGKKIKSILKQKQVNYLNTGSPHNEELMDEDENLREKHEEEEKKKFDLKEELIKINCELFYEILQERGYDNLVRRNFFSYFRINFSDFFFSIGRFLYDNGGNSR